MTSPIKPEPVTPEPVAVTFLRDTHHGGPADQAATVASKLAAFVSAATAGVDLAIYDFRLSDALAKPVVGALVDAADRGLPVRVAYDAGKPTDPEEFTRIQADPAPPGTAEWVTEHFAGTKVATKAITAPAGQLMHSKYVVRDAAAVWTGSANFTDDAWTRQENNVLTIESATVAAGYRADFEQLWRAGAIGGTGTGDAGATPTVGWDFAPGDGTGIADYLTKRVTAARSRIVLASMVLTWHPLLAALAAAVKRGVPVSGIYDKGQMDPIAAQWAANPHDATVLANWHAVAAHLVGKPSTPYTPTSVHDFMHHKVLVSDGELATGSFNFSANARHNAENQVRFPGGTLADRYAEHIATLVSTYRSAE
jgi:phosphatidylserine/phosphatidylglycerophosphate/cardiolipin synthase-like enzyme